MIRCVIVALSLSFGSCATTDVTNTPVEKAKPITPTSLVQPVVAAPVPPPVVKSEPTCWQPRPGVFPQIDGVSASERVHFKQRMLEVGFDLRRRLRLVSGMWILRLKVATHDMPKKRHEPWVAWAEATVELTEYTAKGERTLATYAMADPAFATAGSFRSQKDARRGAIKELSSSMKWDILRRRRLPLKETEIFYYGQCEKHK